MVTSVMVRLWVGNKIYKLRNQNVKSWERMLCKMLCRIVSPLIWITGCMSLQLLLLVSATLQMVSSFFAILLRRFCVTVDYGLDSIFCMYVLYSALTYLTNKLNWFVGLVFWQMDEYSLTRLLIEMLWLNLSTFVCLPVCDVNCSMICTYTCQNNMHVLHCNSSQLMQSHIVGRRHKGLYTKYVYVCCVYHSKKRFQGWKVYACAERNSKSGC